MSSSDAHHEQRLDSQLRGSRPPPASIHLYAANPSPKLEVPGQPPNSNISHGPISAYQSFMKSAEALKDSTMEQIEAAAEPFRSPKPWNKSNLGLRLGADVAAACSAGILVAPIITVIDKAIIENASERRTLMTSARASLKQLFLRPHIFLTSKPHLLIFVLYSGTYISANILDTLTSTVKDRPASSVTSGTSKFVVTSAANLSLCLYKDSKFTKMFGAASKSSPRPVPPISFGLFAIRDCMTIFASFNLPPIIAPMLPVGEEFEKRMSRQSAAQFLAPAGIQLFSTPLHLLGLDLYNRPRGGSERVTFMSRLGKVWSDWGKSAAARIGRIVPAFGVGGVVNTGVRKNIMTRLE